MVRSCLGDHVVFCRSGRFTKTSCLIRRFRKSEQLKLVLGAEGLSVRGAQVVRRLSKGLGGQGFEDFRDGSGSYLEDLQRLLVLFVTFGRVNSGKRIQSGKRLFGIFLRKSRGARNSKHMEYEQSKHIEPRRT